LENILTLSLIFVQWPVHEFSFIYMYCKTNLFTCEMLLSLLIYTLSTAQIIQAYRQMGH